MKKTYIAIIFLFVFVGVLLATNYAKQPKEALNTEKPEEVLTTLPDPKNMTYEIEGETFTMVNGLAEKEATPNSASVNSLFLFGGPLYEDLDQDGDLDIAVWLVNDSGGTGKFHYALFVINENNTFKQTNAMFLGDRIAPQTLEISNGRALYNFAERRADEPMTAEPSIAKSVWVHYDKNNGNIGEWVKDFDGEADPNRMKLNTKTWEWQQVLYNDDTKITPVDSKKFTLTFSTDGTFSSSTDCNGVGGEYKIDGKKITFSNMLGTLMYCEGSQENDFKKVLENASSYFFTSRGELVIEIKYDSGSAIFK